MTLFVIVGPPCGGKSTWVNDRARPGDLVVDYDKIANALTANGPFTYGFKKPLAQVAYLAREAAINEALRHVKTHEVFIIHSIPRPAVLARYRKHSAQIVTCDPGRDVVEARCRAERPEDSMGAVKRWYASRSAHGVPTPSQTAATAVPSKGGSRKW
jgi:hypothetical protein